MKTLREFVAPAFNIGRSSMPQIRDYDSFVNYLNQRGIATNLTNVSIDQLHPSQVDLDRDKIAAIDPRFRKPIIVSDQFYILDGHHRYFSRLINDYNDIDILWVDQGINKLLVTANEYNEEISEGSNE